LAGAGRANLPFELISQAAFPTAPDPLVPPLALRHAALRPAMVDCQGRPVVMFEPGFELVVDPDDRYEAWGIPGPGRFILACPPGGGGPRLSTSPRQVAQWPHGCRACPQTPAPPTARRAHNGTDAWALPGLFHEQPDADKVAAGRRGVLEVGTRKQAVASSGLGRFNASDHLSPPFKGRGTTRRCRLANISPTDFAPQTGARTASPGRGAANAQLSGL